MSATRRIVGALAALVGLPILAILLSIVVIAVFGVSIDASRWRAAISERAGAALGRPVRFDGPLVLELRRDAVLRARDVHVPGPPEFAQGDLVSFGTAQLSVDLLAALRGRVHVRSIELADGRVHLVRTGSGSANWASPTPSNETAEPGTGPAPVRAAIEIERLSVRNVEVEYQDARSGMHRLLDLEELSGTGESGQPLTLVARGRVRGSVPCALDLAGASIQELMVADRAWPFTLDAACPGTRLHASGALESGHRVARFRFGVGTGHLDELEALLRQELPELGAAALAGEVVATAETIELAELRGVLGNVDVAGTLLLGLGSPRPRLSGQLAIGTLDLRPLIQIERPPGGAPLSYDVLAQQSLSLRGSIPIDADIVLRVGRLLGLPGEVHDAQLTVNASESVVRMPMEATVAGVRLAGHIELDIAAASPALGLELRAHDTALAPLMELLTGSTGIEGTLGRFALRLGGRGETLGDLIGDLALRLEMADVRIRYGERPDELALDMLELAVPRGERLRGFAHGTLLGEPARIVIRGGELARIMRERATPIEIDVAARRASASFSGTLDGSEATGGADVAFRVDVPQSGDLARWLGIAPESKLPLALRGRMRLTREHWRLAGTTLKLGRSELTVDAERRFIDGKPIAVVAVRSPLIDVPELATLRGSAAHRGMASNDTAILPRRVHLPDADIRLDLARVELGRHALADVGVSARIRDGRLAPSPFVARFAGVTFEGRTALDLRGDVPELSLLMSAREVDVGMLLRTLRVAEIIDEHAAELKVEFSARGSNLRGLLDHATLNAHLAGGNLEVRGPTERPIASIRIDEVVIGALPGKPITARVVGTLDETPATISVAVGTLADLASESARRLPLVVEAQVNGARLALDGEVALPIGRGGKVTLGLAGERLDFLNGLVRAELPPWGPWSIGGPIVMTQIGYEVSQLTVRVGDSRLYGAGRLDLAGARPHLHARISAPHIQLDDFPLEVRQARVPGVGRVEALRARARDTAGQTEALLSRAFLGRFDASVDVSVQQVLSGADRLADGRLRIELAGGRLDVDPLEVNLPGGGARLYGSYDTRRREVEVTAGARIERFEYGILARRNRPDADIQGLLSLDTEIRSTAPSLESIFAHADGHIDFAVWPKNLRGGVFDRWSVNMFLALLPILDPGTESRVNCFVGRLDLNDGVLTHDALVIDTTRVRALGGGRADLRTEEIAFRFRPRAKGAAFFSLQTPLSITGTMSDFKVAPTRGDFFEAFARLFTSVITLPLETLRYGPLPLDGADVCSDPLRMGGKTAR